MVKTELISDHLKEGEYIAPEIQVSSGGTTLIMTTHRIFSLSDDGATLKECKVSIEERENV